MNRKIVGNVGLETLLRLHLSGRAPGRLTDDILDTDDNSMQRTTIDFGYRIESLGLVQNIISVDVRPSSDFGLSLVIPREMISCHLSDCELVGGDEGYCFFRTESIARHFWSCSRPRLLFTSYLGQCVKGS